MSPWTHGVRRASTAMRKPKLIAIIGATGTGKSELAVSLAQRLGGEIINADAMQLYSGLPVITNKIPEIDQKGIKHHLLGCIPLDAQPWTVGEFVPAALATIDQIRSRGRIPILVGGTHYYTQSLLFHDTLATKDSVADTEPTPDSELQRKWPILSASTPEILARLADVDPQMAARWHPNDRRKIQRSLQIYLETGQTASSIYASQRARATTTPQLRCDTLLLWPHTNPEALTERLDSRVDRMLNAGLENEVLSLAAIAKAKPLLDTGSGIFVSIGYKEFLPYITGQGTLNAALESTKAATRRYAKRQVRWIRLTLGPALKGDGALYVLDSSDVNRFEEDVVSPATEVASRFIADDELPDPMAVGGQLAKDMLASMEQEKTVWSTKTCETCGVVGTTESDWKGHVASKKHKVLVGRERREQR